MTIEAGPKFAFAVLAYPELVYIYIDSGLVVHVRFLHIMLLMYIYTVKVEVDGPIGLKAPALRHVDLVLDWISDTALHQTIRSAALVVD